MRAAALIALLFASAALAADPATSVYNHACAWCHGKDGRGDGPAAFSIGKRLSPLPRDFTAGRFKLRSTRSGQLPTDEDLLRTVERGIPGYMPSFHGLTLHERHLAIAAVKRFYPGFADAHPAAVAAPDAGVLATGDPGRGRAAFEAAGCASCHGDRGRGDGPSAGQLRDDRGLPIRPADLRYPARFKNGSAPADVYRTLVTGLDGTPMPSYEGAFDDPRALADLVAYVGSLKRR
jgi:mono/diheme cytochrome c family protein